MYTSKQGPISLATINDVQMEFDLIPENVVMCLLEEMKDMR